MRQMSRLRQLSHVCLPLALTAGALLGCASIRPKLEVARDDFANACRNLTAAIVGDAHPDQVETVVQRVCLAEQMVDKITREIVGDGGQVLAPFPDARSPQ